MKTSKKIFILALLANCSLWGWSQNIETHCFSTIYNNSPCIRERPVGASIVDSQDIIVDVSDCGIIINPGSITCRLDSIDGIWEEHDGCLVVEMGMEYTANYWIECENPELAQKLYVIGSDGLSYPIASDSCKVAVIAGPQSGSGYIVPGLKETEGNVLIGLSVDDQNLLCGLKEAKIKVYMECVYMSEIYSVPLYSGGCLDCCMCGSYELISRVPLGPSYFFQAGSGYRYLGERIINIQVRGRECQEEGADGNDGDSDGNGGNNGGCKTCGDKGGSGGLDIRPTFDIGSIKIPIGTTEEETVNCFGSIYEYGQYDYPEMNYKGYWLKPSHDISRWTCSSVHYDESGDKITKVYFSVNDEVNSERYLRYYYELSGEWDDEADVIKSTSKKIPLKAIYEKIGQSAEQLLVSYTYDYVNNKVTITDQTDTSLRYVVFQGGIDPSKPDESLSRIWGGSDLADYTSLSGGRWMDLQVEKQPGSNVGLIKQISYCSSCGGAQRNYAYQPSEVNLNYQYLRQDTVEYTPSQYLKSQIKDSGGAVVRAFDYDSKGRKEGQWLGNRDEIVIEKSYKDQETVFNSPFSPQYDPSKPQGMITVGKENSRLEKAYIDSSQYRGTLYFYDLNGILTKKRQFINTQNIPEIQGGYRDTNYSYERNYIGIITKVTKILPDNSKVYDYYSPIEYNGMDRLWRLSKRIRGGVTEFENHYRTITLNNKVVLESSVNERGGTTQYAYDEHGNVTRRIDPAPGVFGKTGSEHCLTTHYRYDTYDRVTLEWASDGRAATIYEYDKHGNLTLQAKGTVVYPSGIPTGQKGNLESRYEYNEFNEQTLSYDCDTSSTPNQYRNVHRTFYSNTGVVIGEASYKDKDSMANAINAVYYFYDSNGRLVTKKTAHKDTAFSFNGTDPEGETTDSSWIKEVYQYDAYGRKTTVIADAGTGGKNLTTTYEYNNQSEVERVTTPDLHYTQTIRDGRGLISEVITGVKVDGQYEARATTNYYYDLNGNLTKKKDLTGVCDCYAYDALGRRTRTWRTNE